MRYPVVTSDATDSVAAFGAAGAGQVLVKRALEQTRGNIAAAARLLGTNRPHICRVPEQENPPF